MRPIIAASLLLTTFACTAAGVDKAVQEKIRQGLAGSLPNGKLDSIVASAIPGLYEVTVGPRVLYVSADGRYVLNGDLMDLKERRNLSEERRAQARVEAFSKVGRDQMIEFGPENPAHVLYVFTDIDCGYCRRLHAEVGELNEAGIAVRYLAFPRAGIGSESYDKFVSVWCSADRQQALTDAKAGKDISDASCDNPIAAHFALGEQMGVRGTPTIVLEDGEELGGYVPADQLKRILGGG